MASKHWQKVKEIKKELAIRKKELIDQGAKEYAAGNKAKQEMNAKYGHGWRHPNLGVDDSDKGGAFPTGYEDHQFGEHWMY